MKNYLLLFVEKLLKGSLLVSRVTVPKPSLVDDGRFSRGTFVDFDFPPIVLLCTLIALELGISWFSVIIVSSF